MRNSRAAAALATRDLEELRWCEMTAVGVIFVFPPCGSLYNQFHLAYKTSYKQLPHHHQQQQQ
jgi:hypothetical protein